MANDQINNNAEEVLQKIITYADEAHGRQMRKYTPERYIVHPIRVMQACKGFTDDVTILAAAILHDVLEDTPVRKEKLEEYLKTVLTEEQAKKTINLVVELTDVYVKEKYPKWNRRKRKLREADRIEKTSADAQTIKYADIIDNCPEIAKHDPEFAGTFLNECRSLLKRMPDGNQTLYNRAIEVVNDSLQELKDSKK